MSRHTNRTGRGYFSPGLTVVPWLSGNSVRISFFSKAEIEDIVVFIRLSLYNHGLPCSAKAIRQKMEAEDVRPLPSLSTIHRTLIRHGLTHGRTGLYP